MTTEKTTYPPIRRKAGDILVGPAEIPNEAIDADANDNRNGAYRFYHGIRRRRTEGENDVGLEGNQFPRQHNLLSRPSCHGSQIAVIKLDITSLDVAQRPKLVTENI